MLLQEGERLPSYRRTYAAEACCLYILLRDQQIRAWALGGKSLQLAQVCRAGHHHPYGMQSGYHAGISMAPTASHPSFTQADASTDRQTVRPVAATHRTVAGEVVCINGAGRGAAAQAQRGCRALLGQQALRPGHRRKPRAHVRANLAPETPQFNTIAGSPVGVLCMTNALLLPSLII